MVQQSTDDDSKKSKAAGRKETASNGVKAPSDVYKLVNADFPQRFLVSASKSRL